MVSQVGRFLDGTINKLLWGGEQLEGGQATVAGGAAAAGSGSGGSVMGAADGGVSGPQVVMGGPSVQPADLGPALPWILDQSSTTQWGPSMGSGKQPAVGSATTQSVSGGAGSGMPHSASMATLTAATDGGVAGFWFGNAAAGGAVAPPAPRTSFNGAAVPPAPRSVPSGTLPGYGYGETSAGSTGFRGFGTAGSVAGPLPGGSTADGGAGVSQVGHIQPRLQPLGHRRIVSAMDLPPHGVSQGPQPPERSTAGSQDGTARGTNDARKGDDAAGALRLEIALIAVAVGMQLRPSGGRAALVGFGVVWHHPRDGLLWRLLMQLNTWS